MPPGLALSWHALDDRTWELHLRHGVLFCDGPEFTAEDVASSLKRLPTVPHANGGDQLFTRGIIAVDILDADTVRAPRHPSPRFPIASA